MKLYFAIALLILTGSVLAGNLDLSTVPKRDSVELTIYNSEDLTLVRETRKVTFKKGQNPLQFSWANTLIDPTSVDLKFLTSGDKLEVVDTTFPQAKPQMLYWNVQSDFDGEATIEITYFTSGITWSSDYVCTASTDESHATLEGFVRITNNSGEEYEDAHVRLVVGTINLIEKIAQLAQVPINAVENLKDDENLVYAGVHSARRWIRLPRPKPSTPPLPQWPLQNRSSKRGLANIFFTASMEPKRYRTAGPSDCAASRRTMCR